MERINDRERKLLDLLMEDANLSVSDLSKLLDVSAVTVRSDLGSLEEKGFIIRTHGGAFPAFHPDILFRQKEGIDIKKKLAKAASSLVSSGDTIMIEAGTTTALIARYFLGLTNLHIVTNSTLVLPYARTNPSISLTLTGGVFQPSTESVVGPSSLSDLEQYHVKTTFIGTDGFSIKNGLTTHHIEGAEVVRKMVERADDVVLLADSSKFNRSGFVRVLPLESINKLITDSNLSNEAEEQLQEIGVEIIKVEI
jgi:DeoR family galactitol utilization operon repressor